MNKKADEWAGWRNTYDVGAAAADAMKRQADAMMLRLRQQHQSEIDMKLIKRYLLDEA